MQRRGGHNSILPALSAVCSPLAFAVGFSLRAYPEAATVEAKTFEDIERQALGLTAQQRARLARELLDSIDRLSASEIEALWLDEAERRASEIDSGADVLVSGAEVARKARALVR
jgi:hypothetical protein